MENMQYIKEYEIDIKELFAIIKRNIFFIFIFVFVITSISVIYVLSKPNIYKVSAVIVKQKMPSIILSKDNYLFEYDINKILSSSDFDYSILLRDYFFMKNFIKKNEFDKEIISGKLEKDYVFVSKGKVIYEFFKNLKNKEDKKIDYKSFIIGFSISKDKETESTTIIYIHPNRFFAYKVVKAFLKDGIKYLVNKNLKNLDTQIKKYQKQIKTVRNLELKSEFANLISTLLKQKAYIKSLKIYKVRNKPYIPNKKNKAGPKRVTIVVLSFVASLVIAIILVFIFEFIKHIKEE